MSINDFNKKTTSETTLPDHPISKEKRTEMNVYKKSQLCKYRFAENGKMTCAHIKKGRECFFALNESELINTSDIDCRWGDQCRFKENCKFKHHKRKEINREKLPNCWEKNTNLQNKNSLKKEIDGYQAKLRSR